ncbi:MAG TPA: PD-(D/E)XK nuclease domain-containing protein, partial [Candidatus Ornithospirochaeta stercorigallinarum]|nr:PD-(D/E)XK nuclease domain-containing protein [Candidatus Ornithospirochaeta stercorigallinarum]
LKVDGSAEDALAQIRERKYYEKYLPLAKKKNIKLHLVGMNFSSEERNIKDFKEEILQ